MDKFYQVQIFATPSITLYRFILEFSYEWLKSDHFTFKKCYLYKMFKFLIEVFGYQKW